MEVLEVAEALGMEQTAETDPTVVEEVVEVFVIVPEILAPVGQEEAVEHTVEVEVEVEAQTVV